MATSLEEQVAVEENVTSQDAPVVNDDAALIEDAINKIKSHQVGIDRAVGKAALETIFHRIKIGIELNHLHSLCKHGEWESRVEQETGFNKTTVLRLRQLAGSSLGEQIMTLGQDLKAKLPPDLQKQVMLTRVPNDKFRDFFERFDPSKMSRSDLRAAINEVPGVPKAIGDTSRKGKSKSSKRRKSKTTRSKGSPIKQLFAICEKPMADLVASIQTQLDRGKVDRTNMERAAAAITNARACLDALEMAIKEKLAA